MTESWEDEAFAWELVASCHRDDLDADFAHRIASAAMWMFDELGEQWPKSDYEDDLELCHEAIPDDKSTDPREEIIGMLVRLRDLADKHQVIYAGCEGEAARRYHAMLQKRDGIFGATHSAKQTGWDRIHDDGIADGQPMHGDYSDDGVYYVQGVKVQGPKAFK